METNGILKNSISCFYGCKYFLLQRKEVYMNFLTKIMTVAKSCSEVTKLLFGLACGYKLLYDTYVSSVSGSIEKRQKAGKIMIQKFEMNRISLKDEYRCKFSSLTSVLTHLVGFETETFGGTVYEESNLVFGFLDKYIYENFWKWLHLEKGMHISQHIRERESDVNYPYSATMLDKVYDITGYLCGARLHNMIRLNRLKCDYKYVFTEYYKMSRYPNGSMAVLDGLPANYLLFRQHSEGLYFARVGNFNFIKIIQAIFMQSLSTDVLILYNALEPIKMVQKVILNSENVQKAFKESCFMLIDQFKDETNLVDGKDPICYLYRFLIEGFIRVYAKDIYQLRLSNVLLSKTGASGIRTALLTLSDDAHKKKKVCIQVSSSVKSATVLSTSTLISSSSASESPAFAFICSCGKGYIQEGWYKRHTLSCSVHNTHLPSDSLSVHLDNLLELECLQQLGDFDLTADLQAALNLEDSLEKEEDEYDAHFVSNVLDDE
jgi:hypothetical protein